MLLAAQATFAIDGTTLIRYENQNFEVLELYASGKFIYTLGTLEAPITIQGHYNQSDSLLVCLVEDRKSSVSKSFVPKSGSRFDTDTLFFSVVDDQKLLELSNVHSSSAVNTLYKSKNIASEEETFFVHVDVHRRYAKKVSGRTLVISYHEFDTLSWKIELPTLSHIETRDSSRYHFHVAKAELSVLKRDYRSAIKHYQNSYQFTTQPLIVDLYNALLLAVHSKEKMYAEHLIQHLLIRGIAKEEINKASPTLRKYINQLLKEDEQIGQLTDYAVFMNQHDQFEIIQSIEENYLKGRDFGIEEKSVEQLDSSYQSFLLNYYKRFGLSLNDNSLNSTIPGLEIIKTNTAHKHFKFSKILNWAYKNSNIRYDQYLRIVDMLYARNGRNSPFGGPLILEVAGEHYVQNYQPDEWKRINANRRALGLLTIEEELEYASLYHNKTNEPLFQEFKFKDIAHPFVMKGIKKSDISQLNIRKVVL